MSYSRETQDTPTETDSDPNSSNSSSSSNSSHHQTTRPPIRPPSELTDLRIEAKCRDIARQLATGRTVRQIADDLDMGVQHTYVFIRQHPEIFEYTRRVIDDMDREVVQMCAFRPWSALVGIKFARKRRP